MIRVGESRFVAFYVPCNAETPRIRRKGRPLDEKKAARGHGPVRPFFFSVGVISPAEEESVLL